MSAEYLRPATASARFDVSERTLARWAKDGRIGTSLVDGCRWYLAADIRAVIEGSVMPRTVIPMAKPAAAPAEPWMGLDAWFKAKKGMAR